MDVINDLSMYVAWWRVLEILPIMPALCLMLINAHYTQNYAGIIGASLIHVHSFNSLEHSNIQ